VIQDITEQVEAEEFLMQARDQAEAASRIKGDFLATMSHELRTPLNAVIGFADAILHGIAGPVLDKQREYLTDIGSAGRHLLDVINDVLDLSKIEAGRLEMRDSTVEPKALLDRCMSLIRHQADGKHLRLAVDVAPDLPMLRADELALKKVLINLLSNAVKFTPDGGRVALSARLAEDGGFVMAVADTGIGMRAQDIPVVLLPFRRLEDTYSRRHEGTGLGLPLAKSLIELHGGRIEIESSPGVGTTVRVHLPRERVLGSATTSVVAAGDPATWQADAI
jgi:signal transduction histidine kinase